MRFCCRKLWGQLLLESVQDQWCKNADDCSNLDSCQNELSFYLTQRNFVENFEEVLDLMAMIKHPNSAMIQTALVRCFFKFGCTTKMKVMTKE